jgi:hypothetical protein
MIDFSSWKYYKNPITNEVIGITITEGNVQQSRLLQDPEVAEWLASGGTPLPADEGAA